MPAAVLPFELRPVANELRQQLRLSRDGLPRVMTWFNMRTGYEHYYVMRKSAGRVKYMDFYTTKDFVRWCQRNRFTEVAITRITYENTRMSVADIKLGL